MCVANFAQQQHGDIVFVELPNVDLTEFMNEDAYRTMVNSDLWNAFYQQSKQALPIPLPAPATNAVFPATEKILEIVELLGSLIIMPCCDLVNVISAD